MNVCLLALAALAAAAQDGGKVTWLGKGQEVRSVYDDALTKGRPMMLLFSVEGNKECVEFCDGALSNAEVVAASAQLTCIFVDCTNKRNGALTTQLEITTFPVIVFVDPQGVPLGTVSTREAAGLASAIRDLTNRFLLRPHYPEDIDKALAQARKTGRALLVYFYDESPASVAINKTLNDAELSSLNGRFEPAMTLMERGSAVCTKYDVDRAPTILILNPKMKNPETKPLARIATSRSPRELRRDLEEALEAMKAPVVEPAPAGNAVPLPPPAPKEKLSDDEIDRKFIQARMNVAADLNKRGMKAKAIEVLEDVLQSYPKHVLTKDVQALLEQMKK